ncbi:hypothetical protein BgiMline_033194 [Biomphalaria glabrata]|nr:hypothetical protein BgiBS90_028634 [Biomphalaria glabrata]
MVSMAFKPIKHIVVMGQQCPLEPAEVLTVHKPKWQEDGQKTPICGSELLPSPQCFADTKNNGFGVSLKR